MTCSHTSGHTWPQGKEGGRRGEGGEGNGAEQLGVSLVKMTGHLRLFTDLFIKSIRRNRSYCQSRSLMAEGMHTIPFTLHNARRGSHYFLAELLEFCLRRCFPKASTLFWPVCWVCGVIRVCVSV